MAVYYLNQGIILEQAIASLVHGYLEAVDADGLYANFHVDVSNSHPFANLYLHNDEKAADAFPAVVVSTQSDDKTPELAQLSADIDSVGLTESDIDFLTNDRYTEDYVDSFGKVRKAGEKIPGFCAVTSDAVREALKNAARGKGYVCGYDVRIRRTDRIGIDIWADNEQVKNELYEMLRLFVGGGLPVALSREYKNFDVSVFDRSVRGQRGGNYNLDFGVPLSGAMISFDVNYRVRQVIIDTEMNQSFNIIPEVKDYVKESQHLF